MKTKELKRRQADERNARHAALTPIEKLTALNSRPGNSKRERARISTSVTD